MQVKSKFRFRFFLLDINYLFLFIELIILFKKNKKLFPAAVTGNTLSNRKKATKMKLPLENSIKAL